MCGIFEFFAVFFAKSEKNPISSLKFWKISYLKSHYCQLFQKKSQMFQNSANLFVLKYQCAKFQKFLFFQKNDLWSSGNLNQNFRFSNFKSEFFLIFQKKRQKTRKFRTFIYREPHVSQFWAKSEKLFSGRSVVHYHDYIGNLSWQGRHICSVRYVNVHYIIHLFMLTNSYKYIKVLH